MTQDLTAATERYQATTDQLWRRLLPHAGPQALRVFMLRSVLDRSDRAPWMRHLRFFGDGRPAWKSVEEEILRSRIPSEVDAAVSELLSAMAVKAVEQFGALPERREARRQRAAERRGQRAA